MANYRILNLVNGKNEKWELTDRNFKTFASDISGFGVSKSLSLLRIGLAQGVTNAQYNLDQIRYTVNFYDSDIVEQYKKYNDFVRFLSHRPLSQEYLIPSSKTVYVRDVELVSLNKTEVNPATHSLECEIVLQPLTFWQDKESHCIITDNTVEVAKNYPLSRPYAYGNYSLSNIAINTDGFLDTSLEITIDGQCQDPAYMLYDESGELYGIGRFVGTFDSVYVNSDEMNQQIILTRGGIELDNAWSYRDLTVGKPNEVAVTFLKLKPGKSRLAFRLDQSFDGKVMIEWRNRYASV